MSGAFLSMRSCPHCYRRLVYHEDVGTYCLSGCRLEDTTMRVLLAEDHAPLRETFRACLESAGHQVLDCATGHDAEVLLGEGVEALITDGTLPWRAGGPAGPHGISLLLIARGLSIPGLLVTADVELAALAAEQEFPALLKPVGLRPLLDAVAALRRVGAVA